MKPIHLAQFTGMNNIKDSEGNLTEPVVILNADLNDQGQLIKRPGITQYISLPGAHSLWSVKDCILCAAANKLYELRSGAAVEICDIDGPADEPLSYADVEDIIYISNGYWNTKYDPSTQTNSTWGITIPNQPVAIEVDGNLPAGIYHVVYTGIDANGRLSGNSPITEILLTDDNKGISLLNRGSNAVWVTECNGDEFFLWGTSDIVSSSPGTEPLPTFLCSPPPFLEHITYAFGRMWGSVGSVLYYSEPFSPDLFRLDLNRFDFPYDITLVAETIAGLFIGCTEATYALTGTEPMQMVQKTVGSGSVPGTLAYCNNVKHLGDILSPEEKVHNSVPIWVTADGIVLGNAGGKLYNLTKKRCNIDPSLDRGASLYRQYGGLFQYLTSFKAGELSDDAISAIADTRLFEPPALPNDSEGMGFADEFTCTVTRDGELI